jgi:hypothetical protein
MTGTGTGRNQPPDAPESSPTGVENNQQRDLPGTFEIMQQQYHPQKQATMPPDMAEVVPALPSTGTAAGPSGRRGI